jgi:hypothetical protein
MALSKSALSELWDALRAGGDLDVIREGLAVVLQALLPGATGRRWMESAPLLSSRDGSGRI